MTPAELQAALDALDWTPGRLAVVLDCSRDLPRKWLSGRAIVPAPVGEWLATLAECHIAHPPPQGWKRR